MTLALLALLCLLGGFGYAVYLRLSRPPAEQEIAGVTGAPGENPDAGKVVNAAGSKEAGTTAGGVTPANSSQPTPAEGQPEPTPAAPAVAGKPIPVEKNEEPDEILEPLDQPVRRPLAGIPESEPADSGMNDPAVAQSEPPLGEQLEDPEESIKMPAGEQNNVAKSTQSLPLELPELPEEPAEQPEEPAPPRTARSQPANTEIGLPLELPDNAGTESTTAQATPPRTGRLGNFESSAEPDAVEVPAGQQSRSAAATDRGLPNATALANDPRRARFGEYEPEPLPPAAGTRTAMAMNQSGFRNPAIDMTAGEQPPGTPSAPAAAAPNTMSIQRRQAPAAVIGELQPIPDGAAVPATPQPGVAAGGQQGPVPAQVYVVQPNDNFWTISKRIYGTARPFKALSRYFEQQGLQPQYLRPGMQLVLPPRSFLEQHYPQLIDKSPSAFLPNGGNPAQPTTAAASLTPSGLPPINLLPEQSQVAYNANAASSAASQFTAHQNASDGQIATMGRAIPVAVDPHPVAAETAGAAESAPAAGGGTYVVVENDNFWNISRKAYGTARPFKALTQYFEAHGLPSNRLRAGMQLTLPSRADLEQQYGNLIDKSPSAFQNPGQQSLNSPVVVKSYHGLAPLPGGQTGPSVQMTSGTNGPVIAGPLAGLSSAVGTETGAGTTSNAGTTSQDGGFFVDEQGRPAYRVGADDTLTSIAQRHLGRASRWVEIYELNRPLLRTPDALRLGQVLTLPENTSRLSVQPGTVPGR